MFKRRQPLTVLQNVRQICWPTMGWRRAFRYIKLRVIRLPDTSKKIASGLAIGISVSFSPFIGTHLIQAALFAYLLRASVVSSLIGTIIGNPWTFPFMWWASISFGAFLFELMGLPASTSLPENIDFTVLWEITKSEPLRILLPWTLGGYLIALLSWPFSYFIFYYLVRGAKAARRSARLHKVHKVAKEVTGQEK